MRPPLTPDDFLPPQAFTGSCHCGKIRYEVKLSFPREPVDPKDPPVEMLRLPHPDVEGPPLKTMRIYRCNCTVCHKAGILHLRLANPARDMVILSPSSLDELVDYQVNRCTHHWYFCKTCGVRCFTIAGPEEYEKVALDLEAWRANEKATDMAIVIGSGPDSAPVESDGKKLTEVVRAAPSFVEAPERRYVSVNAVTLDANQEGLDLREWKDKNWIGYVECLADKRIGNYEGPYDGGMH